MNRILRWIIGDSSRIGISILEKSIKSAKDVFKKFNFKFLVCVNSEDSLIEKICLKNKIEIYKQDWVSFPLPLDIIPEDYDLNFKAGIPRGRQGSFWKLCPPRIDLNSYEIVCDNDLIFQKCPSEIKEFLDSDKSLVVEENIFSLGKYKKYISKPYNSGLYGLPAKYDFFQKIVQTWKNTGSMSPLLGGRDEQGLVILTLTSGDFIEIPKEKTCFVFDKGESNFVEYNYIKENGFDACVVKKIEYKKADFNKEMIHFLGANRTDRHFYWKKYRLKYA